MARKNPVPQKEREIALRLRQFRSLTNLSQVAFAKRLGIDSSRLSSYEHGRVPIRCSLVKKLAAEFGINFQWLAEGEGAPEVSFVMVFWDALSHGADPLFSETYPKIKADILEEIVVMEGVSDPEDLLQHIQKVSPVLLINVLGRSVGSQFDSVPELLLPDYVRRICLASLEFKKAHNLHDVAVLAKWDDAWKLSNAQKQVDAGNKAWLNLSGMPQAVHLPESWEILRERLVKSTEAEGKKAELASVVGVSLAAVSQWRSGSNMPDANKTLVVLRWVAAEEDKQNKSPGSAITPPEQATPKGNNHEEVPKSGSGKSSPGHKRKSIPRPRR